MTQQRLGRSGSSWLQHIDYSYTDWGALKAINSPTTMVGSEVDLTTGVLSFTNQNSVNNRDLFYSELFYDAVDLDNDGIDDSQSYGTGNISVIKWQTRGRREMAYTYDYDSEYKLTSADFYEQNLNDEYFTKTDLFSTDYTYSDRGRITGIDRGAVENIPYFDYKEPTDPWFTSCTTTIDFTYVNNSNKINDREETTCSFVSMPVPYSYDDNGNVTNSPDLKNIQYNYLNLIESYDEQNQNSYTTTYDASGTKLKMDNFDNIGPFEFKSGVLYKIYFNDGYQDTDGDYNYYINDHLGNTRIIFKDEIDDNKINDVSKVVSEIHYYPFGMKLNGPWIGYGQGNTGPNYEYNGIEFKANIHQNSSASWAQVSNRGLNHATYRSLDPTIGMWYQVDPKAEGLYSMKPYNAMANNPISFNDPEGDFIPTMLVGAAIGLATNGISNVAQGNNFFQGGLQAAAFGAIGGGVSFGIGQAAAGMSGLGKAAFQMGAHGLTGGGMSAAQGGSFGSGFLSGALSSGMSSGAGALGVGNAGMIGIGGLSGGIGSSIAGGSFWMGARQGLITSGLNHAAHSGALGEGLAASLISGRVRHIFGPDAIALSIGGNAGPLSADAGTLKVLRGVDKGFHKFGDAGIGISTWDASVGVQAMKLYFSGTTVLAKSFFGTRIDFNIGAEFGGAIGAHSTFSRNDKGFVFGYGASFGGE